MTWFLLISCIDYALEGQEPDPPAPATEQGEPAIEVQPSSVDFGRLSLGDDAVEIVTVANRGEADLDLLGLTLEDASAAFAMSALDSLLLGPDQETSFAVTFSPDAYGAVQASVAVESLDPDDPWVAVELSGDTLEPALALTPGHHDFGALDQGALDTVTLTLENQGEAAATVSAWSFVSTSEAELWLDPTHDLEGLVLDAGATTTVQVHYQPTDEVPDEATLLVDSDDPANPQVSASLTGTGLAPPVYDYAVDLLITADDSWRGWIDGAAISAPNQDSWSYTDTLSWTLQSGTHVLAIHARDTASVISGLNAVLWVDGVREVRTGDGDWILTTTMPDKAWVTDTYDDSAWSTAVVCSDASIWGTYWPADFIAEGAQWVWWTADCSNLKEAWFRLVLELP